MSCKQQTLKKYKVVVCAHTGRNLQLLNGQTIKSKYVINALTKRYGDHTISVVDTHDFQKRPFYILKSIIQGIKKSRNFIIMPANRGLRLFAPVVSTVSRTCHCRLHYIVVGGWLPEFLQSNKWLLRFLRLFHGIYVETESMVKALNRLGLNNAFLLRNFKTDQKYPGKESEKEKNVPYRLCTFSRVMPEKGIEIACDVIEKISNIKGRNYISLDIYGQIEKGYDKRFNELMEKCKSDIRYLGAVKDTESVKILSDYDALVFPTYYEGEGVPGTVIDAFFAGIPVLASDWHFNSEIITDGVTGIIFRDKQQLYDYLLEMDQNIAGLKNMKGKCLEESRWYTETEFLNGFCKHLA